MSKPLVSVDPCISSEHLLIVVVFLERAQQERVKRLTDAFEVFDLESNKTIAAAEVGTVLRSLGLVPTEGELQDILSEVIQYVITFVHFMS
ncbi:unnamed protein product [Didymodactylos carnosus]|uniref:EF-hand domain-containing protein n=1 Tax=Didymodactylos carnosus TaxID=1234261 RepID=A0A8S2S9V5_9BILA|nr:unnamed protein product [Didymodactylos carnosus]CAF4208014.1 unnamed protein product [Didymodactylos carnosus]